MSEPVAPGVHIRVLVADDHPVVRAGLVGVLATAGDIEVVGEAGDGEAAVRLAGELLPDVVMMDLRMPALDGAGATAEIVRRYPAVRVLIVTTYDTDSDIVRAIEAGAVGYVLKDTPLAQLLGAVRSAAAGETVLAPSVAARLMRRVRQPAQTSLTPREMEVLALVARGLTNAEIGTQLFIGEATVKTHLIRTFAKLQVDDRTAAVTVAIEQGFLPSPSR
jgi:DNA-binding NarL/FixJ family response regulator